MAFARRYRLPLPLLLAYTAAGGVPHPARPRRRGSRAALAFPGPRAVDYIQMVGLIGFAYGRGAFQVFLRHLSVLKENGDLAL